MASSSAWWPAHRGLPADDPRLGGVVILWLATVARLIQARVEVGAVASHAVT
jgi:hypothetical protein